MPQNLPHIIIFNPDQWRADVMGHHGNPAAFTPNLDRWAEEDAVSFRHAYCQNPVCTPSRCSFMTGWYPHVRGHRTMFHMLHSERGEPNLLQILKQNGYFVWWGGKNDLVPGQDGYETHCDIKFQAGVEDHHRWELTRREGAHEGAMDWRGQPDDENYYSFFKGKLEKEDDEIYLDSDWENILGAIDFIRSYQGEKPLCIYLPIDYPHPPYCVEESYYSQIRRGDLPPRRPTPENWSGKPAILASIHERQNLAGWDEDRWDELRSTYYGMCARVDDQFGRVIEALKTRDFYDNSAIFFFADHGDFTGDYGLVEKTQNTFEEPLVNVPLLVKPPKTVPCTPRVNQALVELVDISATVYELTGIDSGYTHFGRSLLPLLNGAEDEHRQAVFCEGGRMLGETQAMELESSTSQIPSGLYWPRVGLQTIEDPLYHSKAAMCRTRRYKYVRRYYEGDEFYDLEIDPFELNNRINDLAYTPIVNEHKERMLNWYMGTADVVPHQTDQR